MVDIEKSPMWQFGVKMNLEEIKNQLTAIASSTGKKHVKVLVAELCSVMKALVDEVDKIKLPPVSVLQKRLPEDLELKPKVKPPRPDESSPNMPGYNPQRGRKGNAGDAE